MPTTTPNLALTLPTPDVDSGWGTTLNTDFTQIDNIFAANGTGTGVGVNIGNGKTLVMGGTMIIGRGDNTSAPTGATIRGASVASGTTNTVGQNFVLDAGNGTGTGGSGAFIFRTAPAGSSGNTPNTLRNSFVISNNGSGEINRNTDGSIFTAYGRTGNISCAEFSSVSYLVSNVHPLNFGTASNVALSILTNNTERMRIAANGALGIAGANYGTAGQVLTSNAASGVPTWQDTEALTAFSSQDIAGQTNLTFSGILSSAESIQVGFFRVQRGTANNILIRLGTSSGVDITGYTSTSGFSSSASGISETTGFAIANSSATSEITGTVTISRMYGDLWYCSYTLTDTVNLRSIVGGGYKFLSGNLDRIQIIRQGTGNFTQGNVRVTYLK